MATFAFTSLLNKTGSMTVSYNVFLLRARTCSGVHCSGLLAPPPRATSKTFAWRECARTTFNEMRYYRRLLLQPRVSLPLQLLAQLLGTDIATCALLGGSNRKGTEKVLISNTHVR